MEWLINRRRMMYNRASAPEYISINNLTVWTIACENFGDFNETVITDNGDDTVNIVTTYKSMLGSVVKKEKVVSNQTGVDNTGGTYTPGTTLEPIGITQKQSDAIDDFTLFRKAGLLFDDYCDYFPQSMDNYGYVAGGMVVHFDGIDKGDDSSAWIDIISGTLKFPYSEHSAIESNCIHMDGQGSLVASSFIPSRYQFEICAKNINSGTGAIYYSGRQDDNCCIVQSGGFYTCPSGWGNIVWNVNPRPDIIVMSHCGNNKPKMLNGVIYPGKTAYKAYGENNYITTLGGGKDSGYIECKVYSIRIYSRQLTESEVMHNQRVDNERFNMGLDI